MWGDDDGNRKALVGSITAGILFGAAWWCYIDGQAYGSHHTTDTQRQTSQNVQAYSWLPGVGCTLGLIMVNGMHWGHLTDDDGSGRTAKTRLFFLAAIIIQLACVAGSVFIMVDKFLDKSSFDAYHWNGVSIFLNCILQFIATFVFRFSTIASDD